MINENNKKVPCGGFYLGDGLTMEGDTLKSLGGAYVKVKININDGDDELTFEFMDDSPLKTFEEIRQKIATSFVTLLVFPPDPVSDGVTFCFYSGDSSGEIISINFSTPGLVVDNSLIVGKVSIHSDNKITYSVSQYTLTPTT